jgi:transposase
VGPGQSGLQIFLDDGGGLRFKNRMVGESPSDVAKDALIAVQDAEIAVLKARVAGLERRLELNSTNSGKPPSSDGLKKPVRVKSLREPSGKKPGGQKGHKGETLRQVAVSDAAVVNHYPPACSGCGAVLDPQSSAGHPEGEHE